MHGVIRHPMLNLSPNGLTHERHTQSQARARHLRSSIDGKISGDVLLLQATFGLVAGPLTWSIVALNNSLVLHSLDQVHSLL